jgi:hypothetical protein
MYCFLENPNRRFAGWDFLIFVEIAVNIYKHLEIVPKEYNITLLKVNAVIKVGDALS